MLNAVIVVVVTVFCLVDGQGIQGPPRATMQPGLPGKPGLPGLMGISGRPGFPGNPGMKGDKGDTVDCSSPGECQVRRPGFGGLSGEKGERGDAGDPGFHGMLGLLGIKGIMPKVSLLVRHSQSPEVPTCPTKQTELWNGYSLLETYHPEINKRSCLDLGSLESCSQTFGNIPLMACVGDGRCGIDTPITKNAPIKSWLSTSTLVPDGENETASKDPISKRVSRCVVCESTSVAIVLHSRTTEIPRCPLYWRRLWTGYSFAMRISSGSGEEQSLSSTGSCLESFVPNLSLECESDTECQVGNIDGYWMKVAEPTVGVTTAAPIMAHNSSPEDKGLEHAKNTIGRCVVCTIYDL